MSFWNEHLPDELNRTLYAKPNAQYADLYPKSTVKPPVYDPMAGESVRPSMPHVNYYLDKSTDNPIRQLQFLLHHSTPNRSDMYQTQSSQSSASSIAATVADSASASPENTFMLGDNNKIVVKADTTVNVLIAMVIIFLLVNIVIIFIYYVRRSYYNRSLKRKLDVLSLDGTTDDELKRSNKFNDGDESFILDIVRKKNEYVPVKRYHSPINGFLLSRHYSTSTVDTHTKVSDWISHEVNRQSPKLRAKSPSFSMGDSKQFFAKKGDMMGIAIDGIPDGRSDSMSIQRPIELMKSKSFDARDTIICQDIDVRSDLLDSIDLRNSKRQDSLASLKIAAAIDSALRIDHRATRSDPVPMPYQKPFCPNEEITSFIEDVEVDVNVTSRDECDGATSHFTLSPEETLQIIQMRNYPKVLPRYPESSSDYVSTSSFKRRSMPSYQHFLNQCARMPPVPPPRTTSTLDRKLSMKRPNSDQSTSTGQPMATMVQRANEPPSPPIEEEPEITNALHVGPLLPGSKENIYSTVNRKQPPATVTFKLDTQTVFDQTEIPAKNIDDDASPINDKSMSEQTSPVPKSIMKNNFSRQNSLEINQQTPIVSAPHSQVLNNSTSKIPVLKISKTNAGGSGSGGTNTINLRNSDGYSETIDEKSEQTADDASNERRNEGDRESSNSSGETSSSSDETVKQIF